MTPSGTRRQPSDRFALLISFAAAVLVGGFVVWLLMPRGALSW